MQVRQIPRPKRSDVDFGTFAEIALAAGQPHRQPCMPARATAFYCRDACCCPRMNKLTLHGVLTVCQTTCHVYWSLSLGSCRRRQRCHTIPFNCILQHGRASTLVQIAGDPVAWVHMRCAAGGVKTLCAKFLAFFLPLDDPMWPNVCTAFLCIMAQPIRYDFDSVPVQPDPNHMSIRSDLPIRRRLILLCPPESEILAPQFSRAGRFRPVSGPRTLTYRSTSHNCAEKVGSKARA
eukprot:2245118-Pyramimonas_sp.AAC.1